MIQNFAGWRILLFDSILEFRKADLYVEIQIVTRSA